MKLKTSLTEASGWFNDRSPMAKKTVKKSTASKVKPQPAVKSGKAQKSEKLAKPALVAKTEVKAKAPAAIAKAKAPTKTTEKILETPPAEVLKSPTVPVPDIDYQMTPNPEEIILTDAEGRRYCRVKDCDQVATVDLYCRFHYLLLWKRIQVRRKILQDGKLSRYVDELTSRYPDKFLEMIRKDLRSEKDFLGAIGELEIDEGETENEFGDDSAAEFIEEVRGVSSESSIAEDTDF